MQTDFWGFFLSCFVENAWLETCTSISNDRLGRKHPVQNKPVEPTPLRGIKVLVVEDDPDSRELLGELLQCEGAEVRLAPDASLGMAVLRQFVPDVLVSDIGLPGEDGYAFMQRCRHSADAKLSRIPAVALTAYTQPADRQRAIASGFNEFFSKPVDLTGLVAAVARLATIPRS